MTEEPRGPEESQPEAPKAPTEASDGFLRRIGQKLKGNWTTILPLTAMLGVIASSGNGSVIENVTRGNYKAAVVKGAVLAASLIPMVVKNKGII